MTVDETRTDGVRKLAVDQDGYLTANYTKFPAVPDPLSSGAGGDIRSRSLSTTGPIRNGRRRFSTF